MMFKRMILLLLLAALTAPQLTAQGNKQNPLEKIFGGRSELSEDKVAAGLKSALEIGTANAVSSVGKPDGFFKNAIIKILMPKKLQTLEKGLRLVGYGPQVDEFVLSMNRGAEKASPLAKQIFIGAIKEMTFDDARKILTGGETSATEFFKTKTTSKLSSAFRPIVSKSLNDVGATRKYKDLIGQYEALPLAGRQSFDLDDYVVGKALDGIFYMVGEEEKKIRKNPAARVTSILKEVFGSVRK